MKRNGEVLTHILWLSYTSWKFLSALLGPADICHQCVFGGTRYKNPDPVMFPFLPSSMVFLYNYLCSPATPRPPLLLSHWFSISVSTSSVKRHLEMWSWGHRGCSYSSQWLENIIDNYYLRTEPGVLQFMGSQRVGYDWVTELNWTDVADSIISFFFMAE